MLISRRHVLDYRSEIATSVGRLRVPDGAAITREQIDEAVRSGTTGDCWHASSDLTRLTDAAAASLPDMSLDTSLIPSNSGIAFFAEPLEIDGAAANQRRYEDELGEGVDLAEGDWLSAILWRRAEYANAKDSDPAGCVLLIGWQRQPAQWVPIGVNLWSDGFPVSEFMHGPALDGVRQIRARAAALWILAATPRLVDDGEGSGDRAARRRAERAGLPSTIRYIDLRAPEHAPQKQGSVEVAWSHRWIVNGHWREQPYGPALSKRRPTWITPYVKGPEDKPLVVKTTVGLVR